MQMAFYFDLTRCTGCYTCQVACKDWHDIPAGPANWMRVAAIEKGKYPQPFVAFMCTPCYHCAKPACVAACPVGAVTKRKTDGIVVVDREICVGRNICQACLEACSYKAPQFGAEDNAKMQKFDFCVDRWAEGKQPICVAGCPMRALDAGTISEMREKHGDSTQAAGFTFVDKLRPCVIFKPKPQPLAAICSA